MKGTVKILATTAVTAALLGGCKQLAPDPLAGTAPYPTTTATTVPAPLAGDIPSPTTASTATAIDGHSATTTTTESTTTTVPVTLAGTRASTAHSLSGGATATTAQNDGFVTVDPLEPEEKE